MSRSMTVEIDVEDEARDHEAHPQVVEVFRGGEGDAALLHFAAISFLRPVAAPSASMTRNEVLPSPVRPVKV